MIKKKTISVIIPLYNTPRDYFRDCLTSIKEQGLSSKIMEVIIIDDCSTERYDDIY